MSSHRPFGAAVLALSAAFTATCAGSPTTPAPSVCAFVVSPASLSFESSGGTSSVAVSAAPGCAWTASSGAAWLSITSGSNGTGAGAVSITASANADTADRMAVMIVAGQTVSASQSGQGPCVYTLVPTSAAVLDDAGTGSFTVTTLAHCAWTVTSDATWLTVAPSQGQGSGDVTYAYARNDAITERIGQLTVAGHVFVLTQAGDSVGGLSCDYSVAPVDFSVCMSPATLAAMLTTQTTCDWTATSSVPWIDVVAGTVGSGTGLIEFVVDENYDAPRSGVVMVRWPTPTAGQNLQVRQAGCSYAVSQHVFAFGAAGGSGRFDVLQQSDPISCGGPLQDRCVWTAVSDVPWVVITSPMPRSGDNPTSFVAGPNTSGVARTGTITVRGEVVRIDQAG